MIKIFYILLLTFLIKSSFAEVLLLNCISEDSKNFTFYKWKKKVNLAPEIFIRPIKSNWLNFCLNNDKNSEIKCDFNEYKVKRTFYKKYSNDNKFYSTSTFIDFQNNILEISIIDNANNINDKLNFICKKVKQ